MLFLFQALALITITTGRQTKKIARFNWNLSRLFRLSLLNGILHNMRSNMRINTDQPETLSIVLQYNWKRTKCKFYTEKKIN